MDQEEFEIILEIIKELCKMNIKFLMLIRAIIGRENIPLYERKEFEELQSTIDELIKKSDELMKKVMN
jgi:hypothetical protein